MINSRNIFSPPYLANHTILIYQQQQQQKVLKSQFPSIHSFVIPYMGKLTPKLNKRIFLDKILANYMVLCFCVHFSLPKMGFPSFKVASLFCNVEPWDLSWHLKNALELVSRLMMDSSAWGPREDGVTDTHLCFLRCEVRVTCLAPELHYPGERPTSTETQCQCQWQAQGQHCLGSNLPLIPKAALAQ